MKSTMSKQLCLSATAAILAMAVFVLIAGRGGLHAEGACGCAHGSSPAGWLALLSLLVVGVRRR